VYEQLRRVRFPLLSAVATGFFLVAAPTKAALLKFSSRSGQPIAGAQVTVGNDFNETPEVVLTTNARGEVTTPATWTGPKNITVRASGFLPTSFLQVRPVNTAFQIHEADPRVYVEVKGKNKDFQGIRRDGHVDFSLVYPALSRKDLLQFDLSAILSPEVDVIRIATERISLPSNMTLPRQQENYIIPITLDKPQFRMFLRKPGRYRVSAVQGRFPFKKVVDLINDGTPMYKILDQFDFMNSGQADINITENTTMADLSVNRTHFRKTMSVAAPETPVGTTLISAAVIEEDNLFTVADLKGFQSKEKKNLKIPEGQRRFHVLSMLIEDSKTSSPHSASHAAATKERRRNLSDLKALSSATVTAGFPTGFSVAFEPIPNLGAVAPRLLGMIPQPQIVNQFALKAVPPAIPAGLEPVATYVALSEIEPSSDPEVGSDKRFRIWETFIPGWTSDIQLPKVRMTIPPGKLVRWEVFYLARMSTLRPANYFLDSVSHVSRNSSDLQ
jgi:hypothetical protein